MFSFGGFSFILYNGCSEMYLWVSFLSWSLKDQTGCGREEREGNMDCSLERQSTVNEMLKISMLFILAHT